MHDTRLPFNNVLDSTYGLCRIKFLLHGVRAQMTADRMYSTNGDYRQVGLAQARSNTIPEVS